MNTITVTICTKHDRQDVVQTVSRGAGTWPCCEKGGITDYCVWETITLKYLEAFGEYRWASDFRPLDLRPAQEDTA